MSEGAKKRTNQQIPKKTFCECRLRRPRNSKIPKMPSAPSPYHKELSWADGMTESRNGNMIFPKYTSIIGTLFQICKSIDDNDFTDMPIRACARAPYHTAITNSHGTAYAKKRRQENGTPENHSQSPTSITGRKTAISLVKSARAKNTRWPA